MTDHYSLKYIENNQNISKTSNAEFLYEYQKALLLSLVESCRLTETQYRIAEEKLRQQFCSPKIYPAHSQS